MKYSSSPISIVAIVIPNTRAIRKFFRVRLVSSGGLLVPVIGRKLAGLASRGRAVPFLRWDSVGHRGSLPADPIQPHMDKLFTSRIAARLFLAFTTGLFLACAARVSAG